jgi:hypothetical protein
VQRARVAGRLAKRAVELELVDVRQEIPRVRRAAGDVELRAGVEVLLAARDRGHDALVFLAQVPPGLVVLAWRRLAREDVPPPLIDELAEGEEGDLRERLLHEEVRLGLRVLRRVLEQADRLQVPRRDAQRDGIADPLVEAVVRARLEEDGEGVVVGVIVVVAELVVDGDEILLLGLDAHLMRMSPP